MFGEHGGHRRVVGGDRSDQLGNIVENKERGSIDQKGSEERLGRGERLHNTLNGGIQEAALQERQQNVALVLIKDICATHELL